MRFEPENLPVTALNKQAASEENAQLKLFAEWATNDIAKYYITYVEKDHPENEAFRFASCPSLRKIVIGRNVDSISNTAFQGSRNTAIHCYYDSYAHNYAKENNIPFVLLDGAVLGDVDRDGFVSINDVTAIQRHLAELEELSDLQKSAADINRDGKIEISDATNIQLFLAEYDIPYPIGETITQ